MALEMVKGGLFNLGNRALDWVAITHYIGIGNCLKKYGLRYEDLVFGFYNMVFQGLRYEDLYDQTDNFDIQEALNRLTLEIVDACNQHIKHVMDLSMKHDCLPKEIQGGLSGSRKLMVAQSDNSTFTVHSISARNKTTDSAPSLNRNNTSISPKMLISTPTKVPGNVETTITTTSGQSWCVSMNDIPNSRLQAALDYAYRLRGADCRQIQQGGNCFIPDNVFSQASYAFNSYYQESAMAPTTYDFACTATITSTDPKHGDW